MRGVDHDPLRFAALARQFGENLVEHAQAAPANKPKRRIQVRVLLVDDDAAIARSIELMLKIEEINVYKTDLGEQGVDLGKIYDYDIILLDLALLWQIKSSERILTAGRLGDLESRRRGGLGRGS